MNRGTRKLTAIAVAACLTLAGCSAKEAASVTLAETKSPAQLLRNEIVGRVPTTAVLGEVQATDESESCDGDGLVRSWRSAALLAMNPEAAGDVESLTADLVGSFVDQGWQASTRDASSRLFEHRLTSRDSTADVRITGDAGNDDGENASVLIVVNGPCVVTDGPESAEVKQLEGR